MPHPIVYIDNSTIREGRLEELKKAMNDLTEFVEANMPQLLSYAFFLDDQRSQMTVVAIHPDSSSLKYHMDVGAAEFRKFANLIDLPSIEVYGRVTEDVLERLREKARALGSGTVSVHEFYAGFTR